MNPLWRWLTGGRGWMFGPPLKASLTIHIDYKGDAHLYGPKPEDMTPELEMEILRALVAMSEAWADTCTEYPGPFQRGNDGH